MSKKKFPVPAEISSSRLLLPVAWNRNPFKMQALPGPQTPGMVVAFHKGMMSTMIADLLGPTEAKAPAGKQEAAEPLETSEACFRLLLDQFINLSGQQVGTREPAGEMTPSDRGIVLVEQMPVTSETTAEALPGAADESAETAPGELFCHPQAAEAEEVRGSPEMFAPGKEQVPGSGQGTAGAEARKQADMQFAPGTEKNRHAESFAGVTETGPEGSGKITAVDRNGVHDNNTVPGLQQVTQQQIQAGSGETAAAVKAEAAQRTSALDADPADLFENTVAIAKDSTRLEVKLEPEGMGKLDINLSLDKGSVNARILVADDSAKSLIENNMHQLLEALLKEGITVGGFSVALRDGGRQYEQQDHVMKTDSADSPDDKRTAGGLSGTGDNLVSIFI